LPPTGIAPRPAAQATPTAPATTPSGEPLLSEPQRKNIERLWIKLGIKDRQERKNRLSERYHRQFESSSELTKCEAMDLISYLKEQAGEEETPRAPRPVAPPPVDDAPPPDDRIFGGYSDEPF
jgi:tellurite resistance protein